MTAHYVPRHIALRIHSTKSVHVSCSRPQAHFIVHRSKIPGAAGPTTSAAGVGINRSRCVSVRAGVNAGMVG